MDTQITSREKSFFNQDSSIGVVTEKYGSISGSDKRFPFSPKRTGAHSACYPMNNEGVLPDSKSTGKREADR